MTDRATDSEVAGTARVSPGALLVFLALPVSGLLLLLLVFGPGILLVVGVLSGCVAIPVLGTHLFGPRRKNPT